MKKYLSVLVLLVFVIPSVTFAAWWNPLTWGVFNKVPNPPASIQTATTTSNTQKSKVTQSQPLVVPKVTNNTSVTIPKPQPAKVVTTPAPAPTISATTNTSSQIVSAPPAPSKTYTLPNGAVVDSSGNVITAAPTQTQNPQTQNVQPSGTYCNGTYWNSCPSGQDFVCPGDNEKAYCQLPASSQLQTQQVLQAQQQAQEQKLQPLETSFAQIITNINSACNNADAGQPVLRCEQTESQLLTILQQEAAIGISKQDAAPELSALQDAYNKLQNEYYADPGGVDEAYYEGTRNNISAEMQILANYEAMFTN